VDAPDERDASRRRAEQGRGEVGAHRSTVLLMRFLLGFVFRFVPMQWFRRVMDE